MTELIIQTGKHRGKKLVLPASEIVVGRDESCQIQLGASGISRRHCLFQHTAEGLTVTDLGSRNGTLVNNVPIDKPTLLEPGDVVRLGAIEFKVGGNKPRADKPSAAPESPPEKAIDDDIASWLSEGLGQAKSTDDTAVITPVGTVEAPPAELHEAPPPPEQPPPAREKFDSVAAEAAEIIRQFREQQRREAEREEG